MIGAPKLIFQVTPPLVFFGAVGVLNVVGTSSILNEEYFWLASVLGLASNLFLGALVQTGRDHAVTTAVALAIGLWSWMGLDILDQSPEPSPPPEIGHSTCKNMF